MDEQTLLAHKNLWGIENKPVSHDLDRLTKEESQVYDRLRNNDLAENLRLEQEHISYSWLTDKLDELAVD